MCKQFFSSSLFWPVLFRVGLHKNRTFGFCFVSFGRSKKLFRRNFRFSRGVTDSGKPDFPFFSEGTLWYKLFWITNFLPPFSFCPPSIFFRISFNPKLSQRSCFSKPVVEIETHRVAVITSGRVGTKFELLSPVPTKSSSSLLPQQPT